MGARLRAGLFWIHLTAGCVAGAVILVMSVTGVLLMYERQILAWADVRDYRVSALPGGERLTAEPLLREVRRAYPDASIVSITVRSDPRSPAAVGVGPRTIYVDPYNGRVFGEGALRTRAFFRAVTDWHRTLAASPERRTTARAITGAANLAFLVLVVTGAYLWLPRAWTWRQVRNVAWFRPGLRGRARDFNWHNTVGVWSCVPLFVVVLSGVVISYPWASDLVYRVAGEAPPARPAAGPRPPQSRPAAPGAEPARQSAPLVDLAIARAADQVAGWSSISLRLPATPSAPLTVTIDRGDGGQPHKRAVLTIDSESGETLKWEPFASYTAGRRLRSYLRFAHTGEVAGMAGQTAAGVASGGGAFLVVTGLSLAIRRASARIRRFSLGAPAVIPDLAAGPNVSESISAGRSTETRRSS